MSITSVRSAAFALVLTLSAFVLLPSSAHAANLITNPGFELGSGGNPTGWVANAFPNAIAAAATFSTSTPGNTGTSAATIVMGAGSAPGSDAKWVHDPVSVTAGGYYTLSFWYKASSSTPVFLRYNDSDTQSDTSGFHWIAQLAPTSVWTKYVTHLTIATGINKVQIMAMVEGGGTLSTDDYFIEVGTAPLFSEGIVTLSFDDGWKSIYDNAIPVLNAAGLKSTQYIYTDPISGGFPDYMTQTMLNAMAASGHEIADHTKTHSDLTTVTPTQLQTEIHTSRITLAGFIATSTANIKTFAYPYGAYNASIEAALQAEGYVAARSVDEGFNFNFNIDPSSVDKYALKIQHVTNLTTAAQIHDWVEQARSSKTWLILMFHKIATTAAPCTLADGEECTTKEILQAVATDLSSNQVCVQTVAQVMAGTPCPPPTPVIAAHADVFAEATSTNTNVVVTYTNPTVTLGGTVSCTPASGSIFSIGSTTVTCSSAGAANTTFVVGVRAHTAPVATNVSATTAGVAVPVTLVASGSGTLTYFVVVGPKFGTLSGSGAALTYTPQASTTAFVDTFTFKANDGQVDSNIATATITVSLAPDVVVPGISGIAANPVHQNDATITWTTNEAATSRVVYGTTTAYGASTTLDTTLVTSHSVALSGLTTATAYHFAVVSKDAAGNTATSSDETFTTTSAPVVTPPTSGGGGGGCSGCGCGGCGGGGTVVGLIGTVNGQGGQVLGATTQVLTDLQINAILDLLRSFNADQSVIEKVSAALHGQGTPSGKYTFTLTLVLGSKNADVTALQNRLTKEGIYKGPVTGTFGPLTSAAVKVYQAKNGISQTGTVGPLTRAALNK